MILARDRAGGNMELVEEQGVSIVANGHFNPAIFQPAWLAMHNVIRPEEAESAKIQVVHPEISQFEIPGIRFETQAERFSIVAEAEPFVRAADIFLKVFHDLLGHTPIKTCGINYWAHFRVSDPKQRVRFGRSLAPIEVWGDFGEQMNTSNAERVGGLTHLSMQSIPNDGRQSGSINVTIQPSAHIKGDVGIYVQVNDHFEKSEDVEMDFISFIAQRFDGSIGFARNIVGFMIEQARKA